MLVNLFATLLRRRYDAFETIMEILRLKLAYPDASPSSYAALDVDYARFVNCGYDTFEGAGAVRRQASVSNATYTSVLAAPGAPVGNTITTASSSSSSLTEVSAAASTAAGSTPPAAVSMFVTLHRNQLQKHGLSMCSQSTFDDPYANCAYCASAAKHFNPNTTQFKKIFVAGGNSCCSAPDLAQCPRLWE